MYRTKALRESGLFDERFFVIFEDVDLSFRLRLNNWDIHLVPDAIVYHKRGISAKTSAYELKDVFVRQNLMALSRRYWPWKFLWRYLPFLIYNYGMGSLDALCHKRWSSWRSIMSRSRHVRKQLKGNPRLTTIQEQWMKRSPADRRRAG